MQADWGISAGSTPWRPSILKAHQLTGVSLECVDQVDQVDFVCSVSRYMHSLDFFSRLSLCFPCVACVADTSVVAFRSYFFESVKSWECQRQPLCTSFVGTSAARTNFGWLCCLANICPRTSFTFHFGSQICSEHGAVPKASCVHHAFGFEGAAGAMCLGKSGSYQSLSCDLKWIWRRLCVLRFLDYFISASALIVLSGCSAKATSHHIKSPCRLSLSASQTKNTERKA